MASFADKGAPASEPAAPSPARRVLAQSWHAFHPMPAFYCAPGVVAALAIGLWLHQPGAALLAAAGAFSTGFGAFQRLTRFHVTPMLLAAACMMAATLVGTVASGDPYTDAAVIGVVAFALGLAASFGTGPWWVLLQGSIFLVIAGAHPGDWRDGLSRGLLVLAGGFGQTVLVSLFKGLWPGGFPPLSSPTAVPPPADAAAWKAQARRVFSPFAPEFRYALLLGLASAAAILIERRLVLANGYWAALTVLLVLRRGGAETLIRGVQRLGGTVIGAGAATLLAALIRPEPAALLVLIGAAAWFAYATQWVNYGTFSVSVTSYVAFLMALIGLPEAQVATNRVIATLLGGGIGVAALALAHIGRQGRALVWPPRPEAG